MDQITATPVQGQGKRALVIGSGISGLLTARVLAEYYDQVLLVERDHYPERPIPRTGVGQSFQVHKLQPRGHVFLQQWFPHFDDDLIAYGAIPLSEQKPTAFIWQYGISELAPLYLDGYTRYLLEWIIHRRVADMPQVRFLLDCEVTGLQTTPDQMQVNGVYLRDKKNPGTPTTLTADLIVDASGRASRLPRWLQKLGYELPEDDVLNASIGYTTRYYKRPSRLADQWSVVQLETTFGQAPYGCTAAAIENNTWLLSIFGTGVPYPPTDVEGFQRALHQLNSPIIADALQGVEPLTPPRSFRVPRCVFHHFEQMIQWPTGLLVVGDAFCHFDPIYGQGMTMAALEAEILERSLCEHQDHPRSNFEQGILQRFAEVIRPAWWLGATYDLQWPAVEHRGPSSLIGTTFVQRYIELIQRQSIQNLEPFQYFLKARGLVIPLQNVINIQMIKRVLAEEIDLESKTSLHILYEQYPRQFEEEVSKLVDGIPPVPSLFAESSMVMP